jgi:hypothetical protein
VANGWHSLFMRDLNMKFVAKDNQNLFGAGATTMLFCLLPIIIFYRKSYYG